MQMLKAKLYMLKQQENAEKLSDIRGDVTEIGWGNQIRSYVLQPYTLVRITVPMWRQVMWTQYWMADWISSSMAI